MKRGFKGRRRANDPTYKPYDPLFHPKNLIDLMAKGLFNCEIEDEWYVSSATFKRWRAENEDLAEAYEIGLSKRRSYLIKEKLRPMIDGKLEGKHSFNALKMVMDAELEYTVKQPVVSAGNSINIGAINISNSTPQQLIEKLQENLQFLEDKNIIQADFKVIENDSELNE
jgi:hypothetical protein